MFHRFFFIYFYWAIKSDKDSCSCLLCCQFSCFLPFCSFECLVLYIHPTVSEVKWVEKVGWNCSWLKSLSCDLIGCCIVLRGTGPAGMRPEWDSPVGERRCEESCVLPWWPDSKAQIWFRVQILEKVFGKCSREWKFFLVVLISKECCKTIIVNVDELVGI